MADFSTRLKEMRLRRGLRQKDLAIALGLAQTTIANYEQKLRFPDEPTLVRIADYFSISLDQLLGRSDPSVDGVVGPGTDGADELTPQALSYFDALRCHGVETARESLRAALAAGAGVRELYLGVIAPALRGVGRLWARGEMTVADEHMFSEASLQLMAQLLVGVDEPPERHGACLVQAVSGELHVIGARMVADFLSMEGFRVRFPAGNLSVGQTLALMRREPPALVALSATLAGHLNAVEDTIRAIRGDKQLSSTRIIVGGQAFDGSAGAFASIGADAFAADAAQAVKTALTLAP